LPLLAGGDAGNRTRVRRIRPWTCYRHSRSFGCRRGGPQATGFQPDQPMVLGLCYRRGTDRTPEFMTPTLEALGEPQGERDALRRQGLHLVAYAAIGRAARFGLLAFVFLPSFYEARAPRPAAQSQPSPSKPIIPRHLDYTIVVGFLQGSVALRSRVSRRAGPVGRCQRGPSVAMMSRCPGGCA